ncbi:TPA: hypothetical protein N2G45_002137 [Salmonella enterica]|nr:hypothetical protein [Salmonella enterica]HCL5283263.1 hypothetical protein [Salmonella enterica]
MRSEEIIKAAQHVNWAVQKEKESRALSNEEVNAVVEIVAKANYSSPGLRTDFIVN